MRFWNHSPTPLCIVLGAGPVIFSHYYPGVCSEELFVAYSVILVGPLIEEFFTGVLYYWIPGGKHALCSYFYGEEMFKLFVGNPIPNMPNFAMLIGGVISAKGTMCLIEIMDSWTALEIAKAIADAAIQTTQIEIEVIKQSGGTVTPEEAKAILQKYQSTLAR